MASCPRYGSQAKPGARFCGSCGASLPLEAEVPGPQGAPQAPPPSFPPAPGPQSPPFPPAPPAPRGRRGRVVLFSLLGMLLIGGMVLLLLGFAVGPRWFKGSAGPSAEPSAELVMFRSSPQRTGVFPGTGPLSLKGVKWRFKTGGDVRSSPALGEGTLFCGSGDGYIYSLDAGSGKEKWKFKTGGDVRSSPALGEGTLFCGSGDGYIYALE